MTLNEQLEYFRSNYSGSAAKEYIQDRGVNDATADEFFIGFCPRNSPEAVRQFSGRLIFPIFDRSGEPIGFGGRSINGDMPKYYNSPTEAAYSKGRVLYNIDKASDYILMAKYAIVVEGYMDVLSLWQAGIKNVVASCGTSFTRYQLRLLKRYADKVLLVFDGDSAGAKAAERAANGLAGERYPLYTLMLPGGADPDEFIRLNGVTRFREQLQHAKQAQ